MIILIHVWSSLILGVMRDLVRDLVVSVLEDLHGCCYRVAEILRQESLLHIVSLHLSVV